MTPPPFHKSPEFDTIQVHGGQVPDAVQGARAVPIYATTSFVVKDSAHAAEVVALNDPSPLYSRTSNPTIAVFEERLAQLEGGSAAVATSSGQAAQFVAIGTIAGAGDNIVSSTSVYGGTFNQFKVTFKNFGIDVKFVSSTDPAAFAAAIDEKTKALFIESVGNPNYVVHDIPALAKVAHDHGIPLIVDNTFGVAGYLLRPFDHGADIIVHSATKWIGGHGTSLGGVVIDSGKFDWRASGRFPAFTSPTPSYRGLVYCEKFKHAPFAAKLALEMLRDVGPCLHPFGGFLLLQGLETLSLRGERHSLNGMALARWLEKHPKVAWVTYPGLESHPSHEIAKMLMRPGMFGGMVSFGIKGDVHMATKLIDSFKLASHLANVGDAKTLVIHPASTTHAQLSQEELLAAGCPPDLIRISVGLEAISDIIADFEGAFATVFAEPDQHL